MIDELHFSDIQGDQIEGESCVTRSIIDELHSSDIQRDQMDGESGVTPKIIHELLLRISNDIKGKVKVELVEV